MALIASLILGRSSGSVGDVTLQKWKRANIMRAKPSDQYNPNTEVQRSNRNRFFSVRAFYEQNEGVLSALMARLDDRRNPFNAFSHRNIHLWEFGSGAFIGSMASKMILSRGDFGRVYNLYAGRYLDGSSVFSVYCDYYLRPSENPFFVTGVIYNSTTKKSWNIRDVTHGGQLYYYPDLVWNIEDEIYVWCTISSIRYLYSSPTYRGLVILE